MQTCPKCAYVRKPSDAVPVWQCPACGIAYAKFATAPERNSISTAALVQANDDDAEPYTPVGKIGAVLWLIVLVASIGFMIFVAYHYVADALSSGFTPSGGPRPASGSRKPVPISRLLHPSGFWLQIVSMILLAGGFIALVGWLAAKVIRRLRLK